MAFYENDNYSGKGKKQYSQSKFKKGKRTCPVCWTETSWHCNVTEDEGLVYCANTPNDSGETDGMGRYQHILNRNGEAKMVTSTQPKIEQPSVSIKADADRLDAVYSALLSGLFLNEDASNDLLYRRGLGDTDIAKNLYASNPDYKTRAKIVSSLSNQFDLEGVPGFYYDYGKWQLGLTASGFYVPFRDEQGRIVGLQIRRDADVKDKYLWVSSPNREKGAKSGAPPHFVNPDLVKESKILYITEGALKADIIGSILGVGLVAIGGVNVLNEKFCDLIFQAFPDLERIAIAFDMDWNEKNEVRLALQKLLDSLKDKFVKVDVATWDRSFGKGLDDVLVNKNFSDDIVKYIPAAEFQNVLANFTLEESGEKRLIEETEKAEEIIGEPLTVEPIQAVSIEQYFPENEMPLNENELIIEDNFEENPILFSWNEFSKLDFEDVEKVIFGLARGNVGQMVATTNLGKSTLALNLALSAASGREFNPLFNETHTAKRILYIDGEATKPELFGDVNTMLKALSPEQVQSVKDKFFVICDAELDDEPLDLVNPEHQRVIEQKALACAPDLIIVDTLSALLDVDDENDNAKIKKEVMKPLKNLAKKTNSAILLLHHTGKFNEGSSPIGAYKGRGASAFGALSRTVLALDKYKSKENCVVLSCPKVKGEKFENIVLELDKESRWFKVAQELTQQPAQDKPDGNYEKLIEFGKKNIGKEIQRKEFSEGTGVPYSTTGKLLKEAVKNKHLVKPKTGFYTFPKKEESNQELAVEP